jgi:hypothetical protein
LRDLLPEAAWGGDVAGKRGKRSGGGGERIPRKRKRMEKDVDCKESEKEEVVKEVEKAVRRMMRKGVGKRKVRL